MELTESSLFSRLEKSISVSSAWLPVLSFILIFILVAILVRWLANLLTKLIDFALMGWLNKLAGILLYAAIYTAIYSVALFYGRHAHIIMPQAIQASVIFSWVEPWGPAIINGLGKIVPVFRDMFAQLEQFFVKVSKHAAN